MKNFENWLENKVQSTTFAEVKNNKERYYDLHKRNTQSYKLKLLVNQLFLKIKLGR